MDQKQRSRGDESECRSSWLEIILAKDFFGANHFSKGLQQTSPPESRLVGVFLCLRSSWLPLELPSSSRCQWQRGDQSGNELLTWQSLKRGGGIGQAEQQAELTNSCVHHPKVLTFFASNHKRR